MKRFEVLEPSAARNPRIQLSRRIGWPALAGETVLPARVAGYDTSDGRARHLAKAPVTIAVELGHARYLPPSRGGDAHAGYAGKAASLRTRGQGSAGPVSRQ